MSLQKETQIHTPEETPNYPRLTAGELFEDRFKIGPQIAETLGSRVYSAQDTVHDLGDIALKIQKPRIEETTKRLKREIEIAKNVKHARLITLVDAGLHNFENGGNAPYIATKLVEEGDLSKVKVSDHEEATLVIGALSQAAEALKYLHENGIVHRDFKPQNILFDGTRAWLTDLGTAKLVKEPSPGEENGANFEKIDALSIQDNELTIPNKVIGTVSYLSVQRSTGKPAEPSDDVFSWGVSSYAKLVGELPWGDTNGALSEQPTRKMMETIPYIVKGAPGRDTIPDFVPPEVADLTMACMERKRENRPPVDEIISVAQRNS